MKKSLIVIAAAATLGLATVAAPQHAEARSGRIAAAIIGGFAIGAILGASVANNPHYYDYGAGPVYYAPPPCYWTHRRWWDGWRWHWRRVRMCG